MKAKHIEIVDAELASACNYIQEQFQKHSWWPGEQPGEAEHEFMLMRGSAVALTEWCEKWLDAGQCRKLEKTIRN